MTDATDHIKPTVGRIVWFWPGATHFQGSCLDHNAPMAAQIVFVHGAFHVNLLVTDHSGYQHRMLAVPLVDGDDRPKGSAYCTWMPYQKGQARAESKAATGIQGMFEVQQGVSVKSEPTPLIWVCARREDWSARTLEEIQELARWANETGYKRGDDVFVHQQKVRDHGAMMDKHATHVTFQMLPGIPLPMVHQGWHLAIASQGQLTLTGAKNGDC